MGCLVHYYRKNRAPEIQALNLLKPKDTPSGLLGLRGPLHAVRRVLVQNV